MRKILQYIANMDSGIPSKDFDGWTDSRMVGRGYGYVGKVKELAATDDLLAGVVEGSMRYFTNVRLSENGGLEAICSCPVGKRCKHSVALILKAQRMLATHEDIPSAIAENWTAEPEERIRAIERNQEEKRRARQLETERQKAEQLAEEERELQREDLFRSDFNSVRESLIVSCREDSEETIRKATETYLEWVNDKELLRREQLSQEVWDTVDPTMDTVFEAFEARHADPVDTIVWAYEMTDPSWDLSSGERIESFLNVPAGMYARPSVWEAVAERLRKKLDEINFDDYPACDYSTRPWHFAEALCTAWERAGKTENAIESCIKYVSRIGNWQEVVQYLVRHQMFDKAIEIGREGIKASQFSDNYDYDYAEMLQDFLADAFSGKGDHLKATAIRAEAFLDQIGANDGNRKVWQFNQILKEAEKAGVREEVRKALIHALETGRNPSPITTLKFQPAEPESPWVPVPKPVVHRIKTTCPETPPWVLPWADEGIRLFDSRWRDSDRSCQQDMEFLLILAIIDGDKAEIARRFDDLPEKPDRKQFPLEGAEAEMYELSMTAMKGYRDDIVARLAKLKKACYITEERDGKTTAVRVFKQLGEPAYYTWQEAFG